MGARITVVGVEGALKHAAGDDVLDLGADESRAFAGLDVLEIDDDKNLTVDLDGYAFSEFSCTDHWDTSV